MNWQFFGENDIVLIEQTLNFVNLCYRFKLSILSILLFVVVVLQSILYNMFLTTKRGGLRYHLVPSCFCSFLYFPHACDRKVIQTQIKYKRKLIVC